MPTRLPSVRTYDKHSFERTYERWAPVGLPHAGFRVPAEPPNWIDGHTRARAETPHELVARFATVHGILDLAADADVELLAPLTRTPGPVALDTAQEAAFRRYLERVLTMQQNDPLQRFLYLG